MNEYGEMLVAGPSGRNEHQVLLVFTLRSTGLKASACDFLPPEVVQSRQMKPDVIHYRFSNPQHLYRFWALVREAMQFVQLRCVCVDDVLDRLKATATSSFLEFIKTVVELAGSQFKELETLVGTLAVVPVK